MGAGKPHLQRPRNDRRFPPPGVTDVASYGWPGYKGGGGAHRWCTILTITNLHYQRAQPSPLWSRLCPGIRIGRGLARIPQFLCGKAPCGGAPARPRLARRVVAPHGRGRKWRERPPDFWRWCATGQGEMVHAKIHHFPSFFGGRSLHRDPLREGSRGDKEAEAAPSTTGVALRARNTDSGATTRTRCGAKQVPSRNIAHATFSSRSATERRRARMTVHSHVSAWMQRRRP